MEGVGNNSLLSKFLWVADVNNDDELLSAFCIDNRSPTKATLQSSVRKHDETAREYLHRTKGNLDFDDTRHRANFKKYVDLQRYYATVSERAGYDGLKESCLDNDDMTNAPLEPNYVQRTLNITNGKKYYFADGKGIL